MKNIPKLATAVLLAVLAGCASWNAPPPQAGEPRAAVEARLGRPSNIYQLDTGPELEYATGPYGQYTYMARFGPDDKLISYEQVLDTPGFARIKVGVSTQQDVLHTQIGRASCRERV